MTVEPRTEAGRRLSDDLGYHAFLDGSHIEDRIAAIESEARAAALREAAEQVNGLDEVKAHTAGGARIVGLVIRDEVLDTIEYILTEATDTSATRAVGASE